MKILSVVSDERHRFSHSLRTPAPAKNCFLLSITNCLLVSNIAAA
ncbi:Uncharacterized protein BM_BM226 [Brugia malayi]|uniref:Bm226 n=1 Tax=Brugia malayi TaxID=6279 RepID=A0A0J9XNY2_BRUMA|nr:Uncharacterized protein BM_BM226 [Brugia malayi]CDP91926.1 Bm226 [Brugia malayi]VIO88585.1 Uncharacterized protein BM_BM226 [Brugia malayi]